MPQPPSGSVARHRALLGLPIAALLAMFLTMAGASLASSHAPGHVDQSRASSKSAAAAKAARPIPATSKKCVGALAREPGRNCSKDGLKVFPTPDQELLTPNIGCAPVDGVDQFNWCTYGVPEAQASQTVALVGDSHAAHYRGAIQYVALKRNWHVLELARPHCPFSYGIPVETYASFCPAYDHQVVDYLSEHPEIHTIFLSFNHFVNVETAPGQTKDQAKQAGFLAAFNALPSSITRLIVIRDDPQHLIQTPDCITAAIKAKQPAQTKCAIKRTRALRGDYEVAAAQQLGAPRAQIVDFTHFFCSKTLCYPVVGGILTNKDQDHLSREFVASLAPFLLARVNQIVPPDAPLATTPAPSVAPPA